MTNKNEVYLWFSPATDITGTKLQEALGVSGGKIKPPAGKKLIVGWGTKIKEDVLLPKTAKVMNHPNQLRINRNKFEASSRLSAALNVDGAKRVARMTPAERVKQDLASNQITMPLIGRKKFHQGGKGFWECPTVAQLDDAIAGGAQYFQEMVAVKDEYRLHVFDGEIIHAVKKVKRTADEFEKEWVADEVSRQKDLAAKNNDPFDEAMALQILKRQAKNATAGGPNMVLRSNKLGWKFSIVTKYDKAVADLAIAAVKALQMDFGAVDCCIDVNGNPYVFEVNSGPGLEGTSFDAYVAAFNKLISGKTTTIAVEKPKSSDKAANIATTAGIITKKQMLAEQLQRLTDMVQAANEDEVDLVQRLGAKIIFGTDDGNA